ncbi:MAG: AmmeMemoRadiSam system radical SAM enzyme [Thermoanaerobaculales bacterium]|nr:AmmeMemoRadiSam system radical SAM enzyme [Thermoanaerobaculales bacterium]
MKLNRRKAMSLCAGVAAGTLISRPKASAAQAPGSLVDPDQLPVREASWYKKLEHLKVECGLCPQACVVADAERGTCGVRENRAGKYVTLVHGSVCSVHVDPIEKKPFFHVLPGESALSFATAGCNVECKFCQNWEISQFRPEQVRSWYIPPDELTRLAKRNGAKLTAATYSEPTVFWEYVRDAAVAARKAGLRPVVVSNGYIQAKPLREVLPLLEAYKVDLKAMTEEFYRRYVRGRLKPVLETLEIIRSSGTWLEIVVLLIPGLNDSQAEVKRLSKWVKTNLGPEVPLHFTRFHPTYLMKDLPPTPVSTIERSRDIALAEGLHFVYAGNLPGHPGENTFCPSCRELLIRRVGFTIVENRLQGGACPACKKAIPGVWS